VSGPIVPRWEWRSFGESFGPAEELLTALPPERVDESDEVYLLSVESDASVKVRDDVMDVKQLERINTDGLEQWRPVMKAEFPLDSDDVRFVLETLHAPAAVTDGSAYDADDLAGLALTAPVRKRRTHYKIDGCMAELSELQVDGRVTRTIVIEGEDPRQVIATVRRLGLGDRRNVSVARGIKTLLGVGAQRYAVIDVGTNSVKLHVAERSADGAWRTLADRAVVTRLGEGLHTSGRLGAEPMERTVAAVATLAAEAHSLGAVETVAVGTAGLRIAENAPVLIAAVHERSGLRIEVIPGEEEARLAVLAATAGVELGDRELVVFDTGGGSTQFTLGAAGAIEAQFSVDVGAVRLTEHFGLDRTVPPEVIEAACVAAGLGFERLAGRAAPGAVIGMGGAVTNLAAIKLALATYDPDAVHGTILTRADVETQIERLRRLTADERRDLVGLQPARAEVILAGACIVRTVLDVLGADSLRVSDRALRHGLIADRFRQDARP
jgi:exopolyphosphatase/guanosine-5'-triphosphate,3'-diphosphate pyrophosphatase